MDPDAALGDLIDALLDDDFVAARERLDDLAGWRRQGGFAPKDPRTNKEDGK